MSRSEYRTILGDNGHEIPMMLQQAQSVIINGDTALIEDGRGVCRAYSKEDVLAFSYSPYCPPYIRLKVRLGKGTSALGG